ncbi:MAG: DUF1570 domain-containing protein [Planctomycetota bacterium]|nr:MAG: DUF1570 domain-containing protein [Planctomycetota bacterium]
MLLAFALCVAVPAVQAQAAVDPAAAFLAELDAVQALVTERKWPAASSRLEALLRAHEGAAYVRVKRAQIEEDVKRCLFWSGRPEPDLRTLISGEILRFDSRTGVLHLRYTAADLEDFQKYELGRGVEPLYYHPITFDGPYSVEVRGTRYPVLFASRHVRTGGFGGSPSVVVELELDYGSGYAILFGFQSGQGPGGRPIYVPASIWRFHAGEWTLQEEKDPSPAQAHEAFTLKVSVTNSEIIASYNGKRVLRARKLEDAVGSVGFVNIETGALKDITLQGRAHSSWLNGILDQAVADAYREFEAGFRAEEHLPAWLLEGAGGAEAPAAAWNYPGAAPPQPPDALREVEQFYVEADFEDGLDYVAKLASGSIPDAARAWLLARFHAALGEVEPAFEQCQRVLQSDPGFAPAHVLRVLLRSGLRSRPETIAALASLAEQFPGSPLPAEELAWWLFLDARPADARRAIEAAHARALASPRLSQLERLLVKAERGPAWGSIHVLNTRHYSVVSNSDQKTCERVAAALEDAYRGYCKTLQPVAETEQRRFTVYAFGGEASYLDYVAEISPVPLENTAGMYSSALKQLLVWNQPDPQQWLDTVRHEGFHQYLDRLMDDPPCWFNEGCASYFETAAWSGERFLEGGVNELRRHDLGRAPSMIPLAQFLREDAYAFYFRELYLHYAQSWAFIHFLRNSGPERADLFQRFFQDLQGERGWKTVVDEILEDVDLEALQQDFESYIRDTLLPTR